MIPLVLDVRFQIAVTSASMWPILVEFRSASLEIRRDEKKERRKRKKEESVEKHKSADNYVGRPNED